MSPEQFESQKPNVAPKLINELANVTRTDSYELSRLHLEISATLMKWESHIRWEAQTVHQAHHYGFEGHWWSCPKSTCRSAQEALDISHGADSE